MRRTFKNGSSRHAAVSSGARRSVIMNLCMNLKVLFAAGLLAALLITVPSGTISVTAATRTRAASPTSAWGCSSIPGSGGLGQYLGNSYSDPIVTIQACGPGDGASFSVLPYPKSAYTSSPGYQCTELIWRYIYFRFGLTIPSVSKFGQTNGAQIVNHYAAAYPSTFTSYNNGTRYGSPVQGDVISLSNKSNFSDTGHTMLVQSSTVNSSGNGTLTVIEENSPFYAPNGIETLYVGSNGGVAPWVVSGHGNEYKYLKWLHYRGTGPGGAGGAGPPPGGYFNHIVHWSGDTKQQKTAWLVVWDNGQLRRRWIPDIPTYHCLIRNGITYAGALSSAILDQMPDEFNVWATCSGSTVGGKGGDGGNSPPTTLEQEGHHGVNTFTNYDNASGEGVRITAGQYVEVTCKIYDPTIPSVNPDGYWYEIASSPWNSQYYSPANTFMNGDSWNGPYTHNTDFSVPDCDGTSGSAGGSGIAEQEGHHGVNTFTDYDNASGEGTPIAAAQWVDVTCKVYDPTIASVNPDGYWYEIASSPWNNQYYSPANTFMNGDPWNGPYTHNTDFNVPDCSTYTEQEGHHGVNTFTDYHNASGEGTPIAPAAYVQITCKVYDPTIASVNPDGYWYRIESSPWDNHYYSPANTFMNGDVWGCWTNNTCTHNTDFNVPDC